MSETTKWTATALAELLRTRQLSAREVVEAHLERIDEHNPTINAIVTLDADGALAAAAAADERAAAGEPLGPLHGLPVAFKDTGNTAGMRTTFGHPAFADNVPSVDDLHVRRILAAGAIRIGKTNVPEFAAGSHTDNRVFGPTRNPYDLGRSAGGSSGGACAALAAGLVPLADGSDMGGSLRNPASFCNVVGLRPTPGTVAAPGVADAYNPLGVLGPLGRTVGDLALLLGAMAGPDRLDPISRPLDVEPPGPGRPERLAGLRVAYAPDLGGRVPVEAEVRRVVDDVARMLERCGARVEPACPDLAGSEKAFRTLRAAGFDAAWGDALAEGRMDFVEFLAGNIRAGAELTGREVTAASIEVTRLARAAERFFDDYDLVLSPVSPLAPFPVELDYPHEVDGVAMRDYLDWMRSAFLYTPLGVPALSLPAGFTVDGLPVGVQLLAAARSDSTLLQVAADLEAALSIPAVDPLAMSGEPR